MRRLAAALSMTRLLAALVGGCGRDQAQGSFAAGPPLRDIPPALRGLRVATLNLWVGGADPMGRAKRVGEALRTNDIDIAFFQEVRRDASGNMAEVIAQAAGRRFVYRIGEKNVIGSDEGLAIVSRYPIDSARGWRYPMRDGDTRQTLVVETLLLDPVDAHLGRRRSRGWQLTLVDTHLDSALDGRERRLGQAEELVAHLFGHGRTPGRQAARVDVVEHLVIVAGDFNAAEDEPAIACLTGPAAETTAARASGVAGAGRPPSPCPSHPPLLDSFRLRNPGYPGFTWDNRNPAARTDHEPDRRLDYIFVGARQTPAGFPAERVLDSRLLTIPYEEGPVSDHFGVLTAIAPPAL